MSTTVYCDVTGEELGFIDMGGLLFSPPNEDGVCVKHHLSKEVYTKLIKELFDE